MRNDGGEGMPDGSRGMAAAMAVWTSDAAPSMSRPRSNCIVMVALPTALADVIESSPAMEVNCRSSGLATDEARVAGSPPGNPALTFNVG